MDVTSSSTRAVPRVTFRNHELEVCEIIAHPYMPLVVTSDGLGTIRMWDGDTGFLLCTYSGHDRRVVSLSIDPSGRHLVSASTDTTMRLWDLDTGTCLRTLDAFEPMSIITSTAWDSTGHFVASGCLDNSVSIWDAFTGTLRSYGCHSDWVHALVSHPTQDWLASGSSDCTIKLWDWVSGALLRTLHGHSMSVATLASSAQWLVSGALDASVRVWCWSTGACVHKLTHSDLQLGPAQIVSVAWRDSTLVACSSSSLCVWRTALVALNGDEELAPRDAFQVAESILSSDDDCPSKKLNALAVGTADAQCALVVASVDEETCAVWHVDPCRRR